MKLRNHTRMMMMTVAAPFQFIAVSILSTTKKQRGTSLVRSINLRKLIWKI